MDLSNRVAAAGKRRLEPFSNARFEVADMHNLPMPDETFDTVLLMHALTYTREPAVVFSQAARVLRSGGRLLAVTLQRHRHEKAVDTVADDLRRPRRAVGGHHRHACRHRLQDGAGQSLEPRGQQEDVEGVEHLARIGAPAEQPHPVRHAPLGDPPLFLGFLRS